MLKTYYHILLASCAILSVTMHAQNPSDGIPSERSRMEQAFIDGLANYRPADNKSTEWADSTKFEVLDDSTLVLVGSSYKLPSVNRNTYYSLSPDQTPKIIYDRAKPQQSLANIVLAGGLPGVIAKVQMVVSRHEYGKVDRLTVPLASLMQYSQANGCVAYWGDIAVQDAKVSGTLFLVNAAGRYDHVVRIECDVKDIGNKNPTLRANVSLFIPTHNVHNIFERYEERTPKNIILEK